MRPRWNYVACQWLVDGLLYLWNARIVLSLTYSQPPWRPGYSESSTLPLLTRRTQHLPTRKTQYSMHHDVVAGAITESLTTIAKTTKPIPIFTLVDASLALPLQLETTHRRHFWHRRWVFGNQHHMCCVVCTTGHWAFTHLKVIRMFAIYYDMNLYLHYAQDPRLLRTTHLMVAPQSYHFPGHATFISTL